MYCIGIGLGRGVKGGGLYACMYVLMFVAYFGMLTTSHNNINGVNLTR